MDHDDFDFEDNDLDDLPANALEQLETTALHATQHQPTQHRAQDPDYSLDDDADEVVNLDAADAPQYAQGPQTYTYGAAHHTHHLPHHGQNASNGFYDDAMGEAADEPPRQSQADASKLLLRIKKLEQEKRRLSNDLHAATAEANRKAGEADYLRRRAEAAVRTTEQRIAAQQHEHRQSSDRLQAERDSLLRQLEQTKTDHAFEQHNTRQEEQMRRPRRAMPTRSKPAAVSPATTPKKAQRTLPPGDGFDDDDIVMASPSKRRDKLKAATPKQSSKRKRQVMNDSPIPALQLSEPRERSKAPEPAPPVSEKLDIALLRNLWKDDRRFSLVHRLLSFRCSNGTDRVLEALVQHAFPSQPQKKLSSIVYDALSNSRLSPDVHELALRICEVFLKLWKQCLRERYYAPLYLILDALHFVLASESEQTAIDVTENIIPLIVESVKLAAVPVYEASSRDKKGVAALYSAAQRTIASDVCVQECLELLYLVATSCVSSPDPDALSRFWRSMPPDFVLLLLIKEQPHPHMTLMLRILSTSALPTSLGPIGSNESKEQTGLEDNLISRLTNLFSETIAPIPDPENPTSDVGTETRTWQLRLGVLTILTQFAIPEYGAAALAHHNLCIGRLIKYLNYCVTSLYSRPLSPTQDRKIESINATMKLIYHLATSTDVSIQSKLGGTLGGHHAYHVSLTRLAFSEALVLEAGIEAEVVDMAHDILDEHLGVEEGEALMQVFPSGNST